MKRVGVTLVCLLCSLSVFSKEKYNILYLNSYHLDYYWTQDVTKGLQNIFDTTQNIMVFTEFLDTKRVHDSLYYEMLFEILQYKYSASGIDLILCSDNNALDLVLNNRKNSIFAKPVVFCGIFNVEDYYFPNDSVYGVKEEMLFEGAIESILNMAPGATKIHIVMDRTITSESYKNKIEKIKENVPEKVDITYIRDIDMHRIEEQFSAIKPPEYVYFMGVSYDKDYYRINTIDLAEQIVRHTPGPVFGNLYAFKKVGFVGEACASGIQQGEEAAKLALRVLSIEDRTEIPKLVIPDVKILIDYKVAKKYRLNLKQLPSDVIYLNKPENYFKKYKYEIIVFVIVILILTSIIISLVTNIYKRKAYELRLEKAVEKSEESDKLKSAFLTNMSHEIRTPLNAIMGFANLLDEDNVDEADFKQYINYIITSARGLQNLISEILDISKLETGQMTITKEAFDVTQLLLDFYHTFQSPHMRKNNQLVCMNNKNDVITIYSDYFRLKQIITNLLENAVNFTDDGIISYGFKANQESIVFFVKDNGIGIAEKHHHSIFERFIKIESDSDSIRRGTGLGLSISKHLGNMLNGELWVESRLDTGSTFILQLNIPVQNETNPGIFNHPAFEKVKSKKITMIVIESNDESFKYLTSLLYKNFHVIRYKTVEELLSHNQKQKVDIFIVDYNVILKDINASLSKLHVISNNSWIILQSSFDLYDITNESLFSFCHAQLEKPYSKVELYEVFDELLFETSH